MTCKAILVLTMMAADPSAWGPGHQHTRLPMASLDQCNMAVKQGQFASQKGVGISAFCLPVTSQKTADEYCRYFCECKFN